MSTNNQSKFISTRAGSNLWARYPGIINAWKQGDSLSVPPLSLEYAPILICNANCPLCSYARTRRFILNKETVPLGDLAQVDNERSSTWETAQRILEASASAGVQGAVFTGGGEPTIWPYLFDALKLSRSLRLQNGLYTNGFQIGIEHDFAERILVPETGLVFVRVSINAITPKAWKQHWGSSDIVEAVTECKDQLDGLANLIKARNRSAPRFEKNGELLPSIQVSTIIDKKNVDDLPLICEAVAEIFSKHRKVAGEADLMVVRPLTLHGRKEYSSHDHEESIIQQIIDICGRKGDGRRMIENAGISCSLGFGLEKIEAGEFPSYSAMIEAEYRQRRQQERSWSHGLFLTVGPDGSVVPCTEMNCNPNWKIGDLKTQSVDEIWRSEQRRKVIDDLDDLKWGPKVAQPFSRLARLDRIAEAIRAGEISDSEIEQIRQASFGIHSLMLG